MADRATCPMCAQGEIERSEGRLDQCGDTYLPTVVWSCTACGWLKYEPALGAHWRNAHAGVVQARPSADPEVPALPRRAA
jgi:hypothetical protein